MRARAAVRLLESLKLDSYFRRQDPVGPEAESRPRITQLLASVCFLLCEGEGQAIASREYPGLAVLARFLDRYERIEPSPDPELMRAAGFLHVFHPEFVDPSRAEHALRTYLASAPDGPEADGATRLLSELRREK